MATWRSASIVAATLQGRTGRRLSRSPNSTSRHRRRLPKDRWIRGGSGLLGGSWWTWTGSNRRPLPCHLRNINHLQGFPPETKDLARCDLDAGGRHGAPFWHLDSTRTPVLHTGDWHAAYFPARGCGLLYLLSAEGDNNQFPYKDDAQNADRNFRGQCARTKKPLWKMKSLV